MVGTTLGHYEIEARLGQGGMGTVYRARDTVLGRTVAIKVLTADAIGDAEAAPRILREARAASRLNHPNIVTLHELGRSGETEFLVMEYVEGSPLTALIEPAGLPVDRVVDYSAQIADALAAAHEAGLVHRDVKPGNVMVMPTGRVKVLDFGLARHLPASPADETRAATAEFATRHGVAGTIGYMAPEQIEGRPADARSDVFALGVVIFELLIGHRPFRGDTAWATMNATMNSEAPDIARLRSDTPSTLVRIVSRALARDPANRYPNAGALATDLATLRSPITAAGQPARRRIAIVATTVVAIAAIVTAGWLWQKSSRANHARTVAIPQIAQHIQAGDFDSAYRRARETLAILPADIYLQQLWANATMDASLASDPPGAEVAVKGFGSKNDWIAIGVTPLKGKVPFGLLRWRITRSGYEPLEFSAAGHEVSSISLVPVGDAGGRMTFVRRGNVDLDTGPVEVPEYRIDKYEVTNREFKQFVDAGGYRQRDYWREPFVKDGRTIGWDEAIKDFHDSTGRPGPSTWDVGAYPQGQDEHPVSGVSWYEAAAYAVYAKKQLPTVFHWYRASGAFSVFSDVLVASNFSGRGTVPVGASGAVNLFGTVDMAGNVKEWCANATETGRRFVLGGSFADAVWQFRDQDAQSPFERRAGFGFRLIQPSAPLDATMTEPIATVERDLASLKPVSDDVYRVYVRQFDYDRTPLDVVVEGTQDTPEWRREKVSIQAAYGNERLPLYIFVPKSAKPPFQAVVFYPGSNSNRASSSQDLSLQWVDFIVRGGRVLVYPVYQGTYERRIAGPRGPGVLREVTIQRGKDVRRTVDYLESRNDIDAAKIGYYGTSLGAQLGPEWLAIEPRFKTGVLMSGGFETWILPPEIEPMNYTPRVTVPVLMVNGREDFDLPYASAQVPMFKMLGSAEKKHAVFEGGHIPAKPQEPIKEMLDWLDRYLGPVRR
jgi:eukaryotic-like serine/threonine-protein kinase